MARRKQSVRKLQRRLNQMTFFLVVSMGLMATMTIVSDPASFKRRPVVEREVASIEDDGRVFETPKTTSVLTLECMKKTDLISWTQQIRLKGHLCRIEDNLSILTTKIENKRNGYVATVFHQDREFTTDFIQLSEGENQLIVKHTLTDGQTEEVNVLVTRQ